MDNLDNILNQIKVETDDEIEKIKEKTLKECEEIYNKAKELIYLEKKKIKEKTEKRKLEISNLKEVELNQNKIKLILCKKEEILKKAINHAFNFFCEEMKEEYEKYIIKNLTKNSPKEAHLILFGKKDYERFEKILKFNDDVKILKTEEFEHGFKIVCEKYVLNFNLKNIFEEKFLKLKKIASAALNMEEASF